MSSQTDWEEKTAFLNLKRDVDPMEPMHFLIIFGQKDFVQINYPEDFAEEKSIKDQILPRTPEEVELIVVQSRIEHGCCRFRHSNRENIDRVLNFNGRSARCGISLEAFQKRINELPRRSRTKNMSTHKLVASYNRTRGLVLYREEGG